MKSKGKWFIIENSCSDCGDEIELVGSFNTEEEATTFSNEHDISDFGWCKKTTIIQARGVKEIE